MRVPAARALCSPVPGCIRQFRAGYRDIELAVRVMASDERGLNSDLPGLVTAQVTENAYDSKTGGGPPFRKFGRRVFYALPDLETWAARRICASTSDPAWRQR